MKYIVTSETVIVKLDTGMHVVSLELQALDEGFQIKTNAPNNRSILPLLSKLAGDESDGWHPLAADFILLARKLEKLGFIYHRGKVLIIEVAE